MNAAFERNERSLCYW